jgi:hypothetical protein
MKNIIFVIAIAVFTFAANLVNASDSLSGNTLTKFGTYQLAPSSKTVVIDKVTYKTWELSYSGTTEKYQLIVVPGEDGNNSYKVVGKDFQIMYKIGSDNSGGSYIEPEQLTIPQSVPGKKISHKQLQSQTVNTPTMKSEEYLGLIACFMPRLMN